MLHYDGQMPSGFTKSQYKIKNKDWTPSFKMEPSIWDFIREIMSIIDEQSLELRWVILEWFDSEI